MGYEILKGKIPKMDNSDNSENSNIWGKDTIIEITHLSKNEQELIFSINGEELLTAVKSGEFHFKEDFQLMVSFAISKLSHAIAVACFSGKVYNYLLQIRKGDKILLYLELPLIK